jgi:hypothetical protein
MQSLVIIFSFFFIAVTLGQQPCPLRAAQLPFQLDGDRIGQRARQPSTRLSNCQQVISA